MRTQSLQGKIALITGGSRGIGSATALRLAEEGCKVAINYHSSKSSAQGVVETIREAGGEAVAYQANVANREEVERMVQQVIEQWGSMDILVNNSGVFVDRFVEEMTDEEWQSMISINLSSVFYTCRAVIPVFKQRRFGKIINLSSQAALTGSAQHAHYAAAKAGVLGFSYSLAKELGPYGITVNVVSPGRISTDMIAPHAKQRMEEWMSTTPLRRLGEPEEVASAVAYLASDQASYITGLNMHVNGGLLMG
jgi:3-oxoacyl-[acyl-carrier protein] reductase